ncbi:hypothetical protein Tco_0551687 [Tanacetum coccineum]
MTRSSTKELITPFENPERVFRFKRRLFETPGLMESSSPELDLFSDIEEHSKEETTDIITETMEQYMRPMIRSNLFYNGLDVPTRQIHDSKGAIPTKTAADTKIARPHYIKDCPLKEEGNTLEEAYYTQFRAPYQPAG